MSLENPLENQNSSVKEKENTEKSKEKIRSIEESVILNNEKRLDLVALALGEKKCCFLGDSKIIESKEEQKFKEEFGKELEEIKKFFNTLGVSFAITEDLKLREGILNFNIVAGKTREDLDKFLKAEKEKDNKTMGLLLGYPKTAIEAYDSKESLDLEKFFSELPEDKQKKLEKEGVLKFLGFMPSKKHWQEELEEVRKLQSLIKEKAPQLYEKIMQSESVYTIEYQKKKAKIEQIQQEVEKWVDKLGKGIDERIKDTIIFLTALEINTTGSCEGHLDSGTGGPYFDIESKEIPELDKRLQEAKNEEEAKKISAEIERKNLEERKKIMGYLEEFYKDRNVSYNRRIIIRPMARGWSRLESQGVDLQKIEPEDIKKENLAEYQKEMEEFTKFLIDKYFKKS